MVFSILPTSRSPELVDEFPLEPIKGQRAYERAIAILDRLFELDQERTREESEYFHALTLLACDYEQARARWPRPRR